MYLKILEKNNFIFLFLFFLPFFADQIQGFFTLSLNLNFKLSLLIKFFLVVYFSLFLIKNKRKNAIIVLFVTLLLLLMSVVNGSLRDITSFIEDLSYIIKLLFMPLSYFFFYQFFIKYDVSIEKSLNYFEYCFYFLFFAISISIFGYGYSQYGVNEDGVSIGYSGYFYAGNELACLYLILSSSMIFKKMHLNSNNIIMTFNFILVFICGFLIGTKVAILASFLIAAIFPLFFIVRKSFRQQFNILKLYSVFLSLGLSILIAISYNFWNVIIAYYDRWIFKFNQSGDFISFIFNGRDERLERAEYIFLNDYNIFEQVFGAGTVYYQEQMSTLYNRLPIEIDFLDVLLSNGIVGLFLVYSFWFYFLFRTFYMSFYKQHAFSSLVFFQISVLISISFIAGHVVYSSLTGYYLSITLALSAVYFNKKRIKF
jgi:hypothetical protein